MLITTLTIAALRTSKKAPELFYAGLRAESDNYLPALEMIQQSLSTSEDIFAWAKTSAPGWKSKLFYLEPMTEEEPERNEFLLRTSVEKKTFTLTFETTLTFEDAGLTQIHVRFPTRGNRGFASSLIGRLKSSLHEYGVDYAAVSFMAEGWAEHGVIRFIREQNIGAFAWSGDPHNRYLHKSENPASIR